jgi:2-polyprenyl-6-methoxyphenol hydroxylase-like FAD-dependent oxidoreductase
MSRVLIVGGGVGGASLAILLGRLGVEVELFERGTFPREKACGEGLMPAGVATLERMGLASTVGGAPFYGVRYSFPTFRIEGRFPSQNGRRMEGRGQRRLMLDGTLFAAAAATPGVSAHTSAMVDAPLIEHGRVTGLIVDGTVHRGDLVVAADGLQSPMRKALGLDLPPRRRRFGLRMHFRVNHGCEQPPWVDVFPRRGYELYVTPLPEREVLVAALVEPGALNGPAEREFTCWLKAEPELSDRLEGAEQISALAGRSPLEARARSGVIPGAILLGDAAGFMDPITASGMAHALVTAELLSKYVAQERIPQDAWMWKFERERRAIMRDNEILTSASLWLTRHPRIAAGAFQALRVVPQLFSHLISVSGGTRRLWGALPAS